VTESGSIYFLGNKRDANSNVVRKLWEEKMVVAQQEKFLKTEEMRQFFNDCEQFDPNLKVLINQLSRLDSNEDPDYDSVTGKVPAPVQLLDFPVPGKGKKPLEILGSILQEKSPKVGLLRLSICQLVADLLAKRYKALDELIEKSGILGNCVEMFFVYDKCSILHCYVTQMVTHILNTSNKSLISYLLVKCDLIFLILESPRNAEFRAHLLDIASLIEERAKEFPFIASLLENVPDWQTIAKEEIAKKTQKEEQPFKPPLKNKTQQNLLLLTNG